MTRWAASLLAILMAQPLGAWSPQGHQLVGAIADSLLAGTHAGGEVRTILGPETLRVASLWADCVKGVSERGPIRHVANPRYAECQPFQGPAGVRAMEDYVRRNLRGCRPQKGEESCHRQYHYANLAVQRRAYEAGRTGTSDHDVVAALRACIRVLRGETAPAPFDIRSREEALRLLAHFVADIHQPLHVGVVYLDGAGRKVDPDREGYRVETDTHGGNALRDASGLNLHAQWDAVPGRLHADRFAAAGASLAKSVPRTQGAVMDWPAHWAGETLGVSAQWQASQSFGARQEDGSGRGYWPLLGKGAQRAPDAAIKETQLVKAGARLAQLLEAIWP